MRSHWNAQGKPWATPVKGLPPIKRPKREPNTGLTVSCPICLAQVGQICVKADGDPAQSSHRARCRMEIRARWMEEGDEHAL